MIIERAPTKKERAIVDFENKPDWASNLFLIFCAVIGSLALGAMVGWLGELLKFPHPERYRYLAWAVGGLLYLFTTVSFNLSDLPRIRNARLDLLSGTVQQIHVKNPTAILLGYNNTVDPLLALDLGEGKILYLYGQWMFDNRIFGAPEFDQEVLDEENLQKRVNGMPDPYGFPSTEFTLVRMRHCGRVLSVSVVGEYLPPEERTQTLLEPCEYLNESELFDGGIQDIAFLIRAEDTRRKKGAF
ncbi:MAG: hypothetical protein OEZ32_05430 [Nitrospinota bacterium]|nr:hypothetical protein [Nitrospinota bacterium]